MLKISSNIADVKEISKILEERELPLQFSIETDLPSHSAEVLEYPSLQKKPIFLSKADFLILRSDADFKKSAKEYYNGWLKIIDGKKYFLPRSREWIINLLFGPEYAIATQLFFGRKNLEGLIRARIKSVCFRGQTGERLLKYETEYFSYTNILSYLQFKITTACNFHCKFCYFSQRLEEKNRHMPPSVIKSVVKKAEQLIENEERNLEPEKKKKYSVIVYLHGGEPLLYKYLYEVCEWFSDRYARFRPFITTNGSIASKFEKLLKAPFSSKLAFTLSYDVFGRYSKETKRKFFLSLRRLSQSLNQSRIMFSTLVGPSTTVSDLVSAYLELKEKTNIKPIIFSLERLISEDEYITYRRLYEIMSETAQELCRDLFLNPIPVIQTLAEIQSSFIYLHKASDLFLDKYKKRVFRNFLVNSSDQFKLLGRSACVSCSSTLYNINVEYDPENFDQYKIRFCGKNYNIGPTMPLEEFLELKSMKEFVIILRKYSLYHESIRRKILCSQLGCRLRFCTAGCINSPSIDEDGLCAMGLLVASEKKAQPAHLIQSADAPFAYWLNLDMAKDKIIWPKRHGYFKSSLFK